MGLVIKLKKMLVIIKSKGKKASEIIIISTTECLAEQTLKGPF